MSKATVSEAAFTKHVKTYLDQLESCWYYKVFGGGMQRAGIPDIIACINGHFVALELKSDIGRASVLQERNVRLINEAKGIAMIVYPNQFEDLKKTLENLLVVDVNER